MNSNEDQNHTERASVTTEVIIEVGLDVHAEKIAVCAQVDGATPQPAPLVARTGLLAWLAKLRARHSGVSVVSRYTNVP